MIDWKELSNEMRQALPDLKILDEEPLARHTSFRIGGPAAIFAQPATVEALSEFLKFLAARGISPRILGAGTNVLAPDEGLREVVICTKDALTGLRDLGDGKIEAFAGETLSKTAVFARNLSLTGLEFAHGIPGTVGGGIYMNAGAYGGEMKQVAAQTTVLTMDGETRVFAGEAQGFAYRTSAFENLPVIIVKTVFQLAPGGKEEISARMQELMDKRRTSQPLELPSAGSTFKRPEGAYAGALIQGANLKGISVGGACVSEKHAGFIVNAGGATARDVKVLIELVQKRVFETSGYCLQPEVRIW
ncbi:UDP-N-acetylenolpyruvoylglucosamine reductase (EC 1.3.1.98) [Oscillospiraceae bacterium]|nr:UDP-N-acetylenolpyruvoylglucosamine reductase (EC 1.3.1.98) [Oscillospiraceae bacterium]